MAKRRRIWLGVGLGALLVAGALAALWLLWLPAAIEERAREAASRRGLELEVGGVEAGLGSVALTQVVVRNEALRLEGARVELGAGVFALATGGTEAIDRVSLRGGTAVIDLRADLGVALRELRGERGAGSDRGGARSQRAIEVAGLGLRVVDARGTLLAADDLALDLRDGVATLEVASVELAPAERDGAIASGVQARLTRDEAWMVESATVQDARVRYRERPSTERSPIWSRLRSNARAFGPMGAGADERDAHEADEGANVPSEDADSDSEATAEERAEEARDDEESLGALVTRAAEAIGPRLAPGARLRLGRLAVELHADGEPQPVLRELEAELSVLGEGRYRFEGSGRPGRGGRLGWNLLLEPGELRAEGSLDFQRLPFALLLPLLPDLPWYRPEETRLSGRLSIEGQGASRLHLEGEVEVTDLALSSPRIAPRPVRRIGVSVRGAADWEPGPRRLDVSRVEVQMGSAVATLAGSLEWPEEHYRLDVRATLPSTDCNTAVGAIPADLLGELSTFTLTGRIGAQVLARVDSRDLDATELDIDVNDGCRFETVPPLADLTRFDGPFLHRVVEPDDSTFEMETGPETVAWTPLAQISPFFVQAVLGHEDAGFFRHSGFATHAIRLALIRNLRAERFVYGASTITMQLVKNVFLHREKTLARKVQEVLLTWFLEGAMPKGRILELYLNVIEYGPGVYGIRNAAQHYFGRPPSELGPAEAAYLATILPNPPAFHSHYEEGALPDRHRRRVERFLRTLHARGRYDDRALEYGLAQLATFHFQRAGDPLPALHVDPGRARSTPLEGAPFATEWDEAFGDAPDGPPPDAWDDTASDESDPAEGWDDGA